MGYPSFKNPLRVVWQEGFHCSVELAESGVFFSAEDRSHRRVQISYLLAFLYILSTCFAFCCCCYRCLLKQISINFDVLDALSYLCFIFHFLFCFLPFFFFFFFLLLFFFWGGGSAVVLTVHLSPAPIFQLRLHLWSSSHKIAHHCKWTQSNHL